MREIFTMITRHDIIARVRETIYDRTRGFGELGARDDPYLALKFERIPRIYLFASDPWVLVPTCW